MKTLTITCQESVPTLQDVKDFQETFNLELPDHFVQFLLQYAGASTKECIHKGSNVVSDFLPFHSAHNSYIALYMPYIRNPEYHGRNDLVPFAVDPGGKPFFFSMGKEDYGVIYADRMGVGFNPPVSRLADSLEEFIDALEPDE